ncbi:MAG TPA: hypothetical protein DEU90_18920 [Enterobacter asburiae]|uniref:Uncharacterized protein n=2 Tax=Enterobacter asburiae TaxID=61645 RepID=A0AAQ0J6R4_ENTAS|nr:MULTISPECIES: hypothetical protein [Enterobacter]QBB05436.1 hypothetical protein EVV94_10865 [Enterobacter cloacae]EHN8758023.1 hypothetical protein [Enterobacter asburiae]MBF1984028.1 hypothetical protein [Enterobacter asburiae]MBG0649806.1 hypothetical protein [Enterobacter asburiae]MCC2912199.1 hypothetical protein [Enterobacter asburiae]
MIIDNMYSAFIICVFAIFIILMLTFYVDYRKHSGQVDKIYELLIQKNFLKEEDYQTWKNLGFWGFGFRTTILSRLVKGKRIKLTESRWLEPQSCNNVLSGFELSWINSYNRKVKVATALFVLLLILAGVNEI